MSFSVVWQPHVAAKLEALWESASEPQQVLIVQALEEISDLLREQPLSVGE